GVAARARVLLVEDNPVNKRVAVLMLEKLGCRVDVAVNGSEALEMVELLPYDLVFMDCQMPVMDGYAATGRIRAMAGRSTLPIVGLTASGFAEDRERCLAAGM